MKQNEFIELVKNPSSASADDLVKIQELKRQFPFFQSAHLLLTLVSKKYDSGIYLQTLRKTAISIPNRSQLYFLLNREEQKREMNDARSQNVISDQKNVTKPTEIEHLKSIELVSEKPLTDEEVLNNQVEKEIEKNIINSFVEKEVLKTTDWYKKDVEPKIEQPNVIDNNFGKVEIKSGSFTEWLRVLKSKDNKGESNSERAYDYLAKKGNLQKNEKSEENKTKQKAIIDKIIESNPTNIRLDPNQRFFTADSKAKESLIENEDLVTETLAKIYALQGNISKAVRAYEILSLKFPQKSAYFATLIQNIKESKPNK